MKLDLKNILNSVEEMEKLSIQKSTDNSDTSEAHKAAQYTYVIVDGAGLKLSEMEDILLVDRSTLLLASLEVLFLEDNSRLRQLCDREFDGAEDMGREMTMWLSEHLPQLETRFQFMVGMRPYFPTDIVNKGDIFLIEMKCEPEDLQEEEHVS